MARSLRYRRGGAGQGGRAQVGGGASQLGALAHRHVRSGALPVHLCCDVSRVSSWERGLLRGLLQQDVTNKDVTATTSS